MNALLIAVVLATPASFQGRNYRPPTPGPRDLPLRRAQQIAQTFADRAGFKVKVAALQAQFVVTEPSSRNGYPMEDGRKWYFGGPEIHFTVGAQSGRLISFRRGNRMDDGDRLNAMGPHTSSREVLVKHALAVARRLGLFKPIRIRTGGTWDENRRPQLPGSSYVVLSGRRREIHLRFHRKDGDLVSYGDSSDAPNIGPKHALTPGRADISGKAAVQAASKFLVALRLPPIQYEDSFATLQTLLPIHGKKSWHIDHPNCIAEIDPKGGNVLSLRHLSEQRFFKQGDRPFVSSKTQAEQHLRSLVARVGVPSSAKADVRITNELVSRIGWVGQIQGTFTWQSKSCHIFCDLRRGEIIRIDFLKPRSSTRATSEM